MWGIASKGLFISNFLQVWMLCLSVFYWFCIFCLFMRIYRSKELRDLYVLIKRQNEQTQLWWMLNIWPNFQKIFFLRKSKSVFQNHSGQLFVDSLSELYPLGIGRKSHMQKTIYSMFNCSLEHLDFAKNYNIQQWQIQNSQFLYLEFFPVNIYLFKVDNRNTRKRCEICSKLTLKPTERPQWPCLLWTGKCLLGSLLKNTSSKSTIKTLGQVCG